MANKNVLIKPDPIQDVKFTAGATVTKGTPYYKNTLHGVLLHDASSGESVAMDISSRTHQLNVAGLTVSAGTILYITTAQALTTTAGTNRPFGIATTAKDSYDTSDVLILPQNITIPS